MARNYGKKNRNHGPKKPPLTVADRCLYCLGVIVTIALPVVLIVLPELLFHRLICNDPSIVAVSSGNNLFRIPFTLVIILRGLLFCFSGLEEKAPLFGHREGKYPYPKWSKEYPFFSKEGYEKRRKEKQEDRRKEQDAGLPFYRRISLLRSAVLCLSFLLFLISFSRYWIIDTENCFRRYDFYCIETHTSELSTIEKMEISIDRIHKKRGFDNYSLVLRFYPHKETAIKFRVGGFSGEGAEESLKQILNIKTQLPPEKIAYRSIANLDNFLDRANYTPQEEALIYELLALPKEGSDTP